MSILKMKRSPKTRFKKNDIDKQEYNDSIEAHHEYFVRIYYEDTDSAGIVYYANYLKFVERARTEMMRSLKLTHSELRKKYNIFFAVRNCSIDYLSPAKIDDGLLIRSWVKRILGASLLIDHKIFLEDKCLVNVSLRLAVMNINRKPVRLPDNLRKLFLDLNA
ncbi:hypothetical protein CMK19_21930 [Candidatus Poribacteria bacterium]|nr:hypothetical protein [Candidatus Poribacteria bacterium]